MGPPLNVFDTTKCGASGYCGAWLVQNGQWNHQTRPPGLVGADLGIYIPSTGLYCKFWCVIGFLLY